MGQPAAFSRLACSTHEPWRGHDVCLPSHTSFSKQTSHSCALLISTLQDTRKNTLTLTCTGGALARQARLPKASRAARRRCPGARSRPHQPRSPAQRNARQAASTSATAASVCAYTATRSHEPRPLNPHGPRLSAAPACCPLPAAGWRPRPHSTAGPPPPGRRRWGWSRPQSPAPSCNR